MILCNPCIYGKWLKMSPVQDFTLYEILIWIIPGLARLKLGDDLVYAMGSAWHSSTVLQQYMTSSKIPVPRLRWLPADFLFIQRLRVTIRAWYTLIGGRYSVSLTNQDRFTQPSISGEGDFSRSLTHKKADVSIKARRPLARLPNCQEKKGRRGEMFFAFFSSCSQHHIRFIWFHSIPAYPYTSPFTITLYQNEDTNPIHPTHHRHRTPFPHTRNYRKKYTGLHTAAGSIGSTHATTSTQRCKRQVRKYNWDTVHVRVEGRWYNDINCCRFWYCKHSVVTLETSEEIPEKGGGEIEWRDPYSGWNEHGATAHHWKQP